MFIKTEDRHSNIHEATFWHTGTDGEAMDNAVLWLKARSAS